MRAIVLISLLLLPQLAKAINPNLQERAMVERALKCTSMRVDADPWTLLTMLRQEESANVPNEMRGFTLANACGESGFNPTKKGDGRCKDGTPYAYIRVHKRCLSSERPTWKALGIMQFWPFSENRWGLDRTSMLQSAELLLFLVSRQLPKVNKLCHQQASETESLWKTAWVRAIRHPSDPRCREIPKHWNRFTRMRRDATAITQSTECKNQSSQRDLHHTWT